ncbi:MAG TPA: PKD domain-containing protein [Cyclobacteriaceae bacterium]|nr:PKD domain-containing protein [Cyclobacteriaceae bacterium]
MNYLKVIGFLLFLLTSIGQAFSQANTQDPLFKEPYVDVDEWRDTPTRHRYVHGGFKGTTTRFSFYFPVKEKYKNRFFQYITPVPDSETLSQGGEGEEDKIGFSLSHGAYFIETNGGGITDPMAGFGPNATIGAYRANAACATYSRVVAKDMYGDHRTYGYAFGGSGGAYRTLGAAENTIGVWDGTVPFVLGTPMAIPNQFSVRMHGMRVLKNKLPQIVDALEPGGSGDMYAGLNDEEKAALKEVTAMGFPTKAWFNYKNMGIHAFPAVYPGMLMADGGYFKDFWTKPGYLGADNPASFSGDRIQQKVVIEESLTKIELSKLGIGLADNPGKAKGSADRAWENLDKQDTTVVAFRVKTQLPSMQFLGGDLNVLSGDAKGKTIILKAISNDILILGAADPTVADKIKSGDEVEIDNSNFLAAQTYHRHQVPGKEYYVWDQFRNASGDPIYPQRPMLIGPLFTRATVGSLPTGKFNGKMILLESLWDTEAFPWQADWYRARVKEQLGDSIDNNFRLYFTDYANHADFKNPGDPTHLVSYIGVLQQALLDLSAWVEKGIEPPANTSYKIVDAQVIVPTTAKDRLGMQPIVTLKANGSERAEVKKGKPVTFSATIDVPPNAGKVVAAEWDFEGEGTFPVAGKFTADKNSSSVNVQATYRFTKAGTYFVTLRGTSQREGDITTPYTRIRNLGRVRVVVTK